MNEKTWLVQKSETSGEKLEKSEQGRGSGEMRLEWYSRSDLNSILFDHEEE
jgi:hypothetical protein